MHAELKPSHQFDPELVAADVHSLCSWSLCSVAGSRKRGNVLNRAKWGERRVNTGGMTEAGLISGQQAGQSSWLIMRSS